MSDPNSGPVPPVPPPGEPVTPPPAAPVPPTGSEQPPVYAQPAYAQPAPAAPKTLSLIGMIAGIVGVVSFGWFALASIAALVLGYMGKKREGEPAKGFWLTAIITGYVGLAITVIGGAFLLIAWIALMNAGNGYVY